MTVTPVMAVTWYWGAHPDKERLVFAFDRPVGDFSLERTGRQQLSLTLPFDAGNLSRQAGSKPPSDMEVLGSPAGAGRSFRIPTSTDEFGYIAFVANDTKLVVDVFRDSMGARWRPQGGPAPRPESQPESQPESMAVPQPVQQKQEPVTQSPASETPRQNPPRSQQQPAAGNRTVVEAPGTRDLRVLEPQQKPEPLPQQQGDTRPYLAETEQGADNAGNTAVPPSTNTEQVMPSDQRQGAQESPAAIVQGTTPAEPAPKVQSGQSDGGAQRPFFAVPYTFRSRVNTGGPEEWQPRPRVRDVPASNVLRDDVVAQTPMPDAVNTQQRDTEQRGTEQRNTESAASGTISDSPATNTADSAGDSASMTAFADTAPSPAIRQSQSQSQAQSQSQPQSQPQTQPESARDAVPRAQNTTQNSAPRAEQQNSAQTDSMQSTGNAPVEDSTRNFIRMRVDRPGGQATVVSRSAPAEALSPDAQDNGSESASAESGSTTGLSDENRPEAGPANAETHQAVTQPPAQNNAVDSAPETTAVPQSSGTPAGGTEQRFAVNEQQVQPEPYPQQDSLPSEEPKVQPEPLQPPDKQLEPVIDNRPTGPEPEVIYVDAEGNPVPPPPDPQEMLFQAKAAFNNGEVAAALEQFKVLKRMNTLTDEQREEVLYGIADATYSMGKDDLITNFDSVVNTTTEAMNYNLKSDSVPSALMRLGLVNMKTGNIREAEAYFNILRRKYPDSDLIPQTYYHWGKHYFDKGEWDKAADNYQYVVQNYPDSKFVREAGVDLARSLYRLGFYDQAYQIVDFVEKRWPRFYVEYPPFLNIMGDVAFRMKEYEKARVNYWTYYNIDPDGEEADMILARLGDIYLLDKENDSARQVYEEAARKFPDRDGGLISLMRLAEESINDDPSISDMFSVFDRPYNMRPLQIYSRIIEDHPDSELVPLARLKKAMWYLWNKQYPEALTTATSFRNNHPDHELSDRVREVALRAFNVMVADNIKEGNYERILSIWDQFPIVRGQETELAPESRIALGLSYWKKGQPSKALEVVDPFFRDLKVPDYSEEALALALSVYVDNEMWEDVLKLDRRIELWELNPKFQRQLDYAKALAYENLDRSEDALPIWTSLRNNKDVPASQEANTFYFLAREAQQREDYETAYRYAQQALRGFREMASQDPERADPNKERDLLASLMDITEATGRAKESLDWAREYAETIDRNSPDYPALRYRLARLYKKNGDLERWRSILTDLRSTSPQSLYGRMADSELNTHDLTEGASQFSPTGRL